MSVQRGTACIVFDIDFGPSGLDLSGWKEGPLSTELGRAFASDAKGRLTYFEPRVGESLYGTAQNPSRWHRRVTPSDSDGASVRAVEVLRLPAVLDGRKGRKGMAVLHMGLPSSPLEHLPRFASLPENEREYSRLLPPGARISEGRKRAWTLCHVTFDEDDPGEVMPPSYKEWGARDQWLWLLASATSFEAFPPDPEDEELFAGRVRLSADWQALVLRDGAAFLGTSADSGDDGTFHAAAEVFVHSLYLDTFLLGHMQVLGINAIANSLANLRTHEANARSLASLEGRMIEFRGTLWSSHITTRRKANEFLERFQHQHALPELLSRVDSGLSDATRYVEAVRSRRSALAFGLVSVVGLPFGVAYAAGALWGSPTPWTLLVCTLAAFTVSLLLILLSSPLRQAVSDELRKSEE